MDNELISVADARRFARARLAEFRAAILAGLPTALAPVDEECARRVTAEVERRLDDAIAKCEQRFVESLTGGLHG